jgi:hypothetical protein
MDRDEALELLRGGQEGVAEWNRRRADKVDFPILGAAELRGANLGGANLSGANLMGAQLSWANLKMADLRGVQFNLANLMSADLSGANLTAAHLDGAILIGANLIGANLDGADLILVNLMMANIRGANLSEANLSGTNLTKAYLHGANLAKANCSAAIFADLDLSNIKGLESIVHKGPSSVGINTIVRSGGNIPEVFLRGCGVPENLIQSLPLVLNSTEPIQFYSCFISYSSKNQEFAEHLHADLQAKGVRTWFDEDDLKTGDKIRPRINEAIRAHDKLLLVLSEQSIASDWVEGEVEAALERERRENRTVLFPIQLDDSIRETPTAWASHVRQTRHILDFRGWENHTAYQNAFARLLRDLKSEKSTGAKPT